MHLKIPSNAASYAVGAEIGFLIQGEYLEHSELPSVHCNKGIMTSKPSKTRDYVHICGIARSVPYGELNARPSWASTGKTSQTLRRPLFITMAWRCTLRKTVDKTS